MAVTFCRQLKASARNAPSLKRRGSHAVEETSNWISDFKTGNASTVEIIQTIRASLRTLSRSLFMSFVDVA